MRSRDTAKTSREDRQPRGLESLGSVLVRVLEDSWNARAAALNAARQEEKTPLARTGQRRAQSNPEEDGSQGTSSLRKAGEGI